MDQWRDTSSAAKTARLMADQREAAYQRYRAELKSGHELTLEARLQIRKEIEADPALSVDRTVPKDFISDEEMEAKFPDLQKWKEELAAKETAAKQGGGGRRGRSKRRAQLHRRRLGCFQDALADLRVDAGKLSRAR